MRLMKVKGVSIALFNADSVIWHEAFGYENAETKTLTGFETKYMIGSITKTFTARAGPIGIVERKKPGFRIDEIDFAGFTLKVLRIIDGFCIVLMDCCFTMTIMKRSFNRVSDS